MSIPGSGTDFTGARGISKRDLSPIEEVLFASLPPGFFHAAIAHLACRPDCSSQWWQFEKDTTPCENGCVRCFLSFHCRILPSRPRLAAVLNLFPEYLPRQPGQRWGFNSPCPGWKMHLAQLRDLRSSLSYVFTHPQGALSLPDSRPCFVIFSVLI